MTAEATTAALARAVLDAAKAKGWRIATAESCTGGMIVAALTDHAGSSAVIERGLISYSNGAKTELLGVDPDLIARHGAVSEPVVRAMAEGVLARAPVQLTVAVTGIAGPGGGSAAKPVGLVHFAVAIGQTTVHAQHVFAGDRAAVRQQTVARALTMVLAALR